VHEIILPAKPEHLSIINGFLEQEASAAFAGRLDKIKMAVEELLMNVFHYAYEPEVSGQARIGCRVAHLDGKPFFCVRLCDWGRPYNPFAEAPKPNLGACLAERSIGGLGLHIVKKFTAHHVYSRAGDMNDVELFFAPDGLDA
jgi:anti-sigma regulatory factor (Ser/Thr protein kinase)